MEKLTRKQILERADWRSIAVGASFAQLRKVGVEPDGFTLQNACGALDDLRRIDADLIASKYWFKYSADSEEMKRFNALWRKEWRRRL